MWAEGLKRQLQDKVEKVEMETKGLQLRLQREIDDLERRHRLELDDHRQQQGSNELLDRSMIG